jgi:hypothetical protein
MLMMVHGNQLSCSILATGVVHDHPQHQIVMGR